MSEILLHRPHGLKLAEAKLLAETIAQRVHADFGGSYTWERDTLRFWRAGASGRVVVTPEDIEIRVNINFVLTPVHARMVREILAFCDEYLDRRPAGRPAEPPALRSSPIRSSRSHRASRAGQPK